MGKVYVEVDLVFLGVDDYLMLFGYINVDEIFSYLVDK